ncbi:MAG TPA: porin [Burkholderiales bacterium]|nr:porin [Burkholderiales bacterium]
MNKKLMALAVAAAVTAPGLAVAQTSNTPTAIVPSPGLATSQGITLYGRLDETIMIDKFASSPSAAGVPASQTKNDLFSAGNAMGFKGREDLGGGMAAWFQLEIGVWPDARMEAGATVGNNWGGRNSAIGLSGGFGDVLAGVWDTPYKVIDGVWNSVTSGGFSAAGVLMNVGDSTGALANVGCTNTVSNASGALAAIPVCVTEATSNGTAFSRRVNNSIQYWTPIMAGFQVKLMTALANYAPASSAAESANGQPKPAEYSASVTWVRGPLSVGLGYDQHTALRPGTAAGQTVDPKDTGVQLGAKFNFGPGEIGAAYEQIKYGDNGVAAGANNGGMTVPAWVINGRFNVGPGAIWASYANSSGGKSCSFASGAQTIGAAACGVSAKEYSLGYDYVLSKRTKLYIAYNKIDNGFDSGKGIGSSYYYIAGPATSSGQGTAGALGQGVDVTTYGLGVQHVF